MKREKKLFFVLVFVLMTVVGFPQQKMLTLKDVNWMNPALYPVRVSQLKWMPEQNNYVYQKNHSAYKVSAQGGSETVLFSLEDINEKLFLNGFDTLKKLPYFDFLNDENIVFSQQGAWYLYNLENGSLKLFNRLPEDAQNVDRHEKSGNIAYTIGNNLFVAVNNDQIAVTDDSNKGIVNGQTVHRVEFGISKGTFWSPDGQKLAFYRKDETMVADYPLVDINTRIATVENIKYPMAGEKSHQVTLGVFDINSGKTVFMNTGVPKDHYLTSVTWDPSGKYIYIAILNRDQNHLKLNKYDAATGKLVRTLFEESDPKYVEPEHPLYFDPHHPERFVWFSERDGYDHLYLYDTTGKMLKQLTKGDWIVTDFIGWYGKNKLFFQATKESPLQKNIYGLKVNSGKINRVSPDHGTHNAIVSFDGKYIIDVYSNTETAREYKLLNESGKTVRVIKENNRPLEDYKLGKTKIFTLHRDTLPDLYCRLITPPGFDSSRKYPVIVYVYGGPHAQLVTDSWLGGAGLFLNYLAQKGYLIFTLDNRGSANRGKDFEQAIFRHCGSVEVEDQMAGVSWLKSQPYVDSTRIGVDGWSYGGFMTLSLKLKNPGVFKVAVAGGPVIDWKYYEVMYGERYMDTPQTNPKGYQESSLLNYVDNLEGKVMIIHDALDKTVVWQHSLLFIQKAIKHGKQVDYFVYPNHEHNVRGKDRVHLYEKITEYFNQNL